MLITQKIGSAPALRKIRLPYCGHGYVNWSSLVTKTECHAPRFSNVGCLI